MKKKILLAIGLAVLFTINTVIGQTLSPVTTYGGSKGYIPKWTSKTQPILGNTGMLEDEFGNIIIGAAGTTTPTAKLNIFGSTYIADNMGLGTLTPLQKLHIENGSILINNNTTTNPDLIIGRNEGVNMPCISLRKTYDYGGGHKTIVTSNFDIKLDNGAASFWFNDGTLPSNVLALNFISGGIEIPGSVSIAAPLLVSGQAGFGSNISVNGASNFAGNVVIGNSGQPANLTVNGNTTITGSTAYMGNFSLGTTTATEKLNIKGNILWESQTSQTGGAFKFENVTMPNGHGGYYDLFKISYNNYPASYITISASNMNFVKRSLYLKESEITIDDANSNRTVYIHQDGRIWAKKLLLAETEMWPDYVFEDNYNLQSLPELESYLKANKHLPDMPTANEIKDNGLDVGAVNTLLVKKVEELSLYLIEQNKQNETQQKQIEAQQKQIEELMQKVNK